MSETDLTRERLLAAAGQVFAEEGFQGATIRKIKDCAGANIAGACLHKRRAVRVETDEDGSGQTVRWPRRTRRAPADEQPALGHGTRLGLAPRPAKPFGRGCETLIERLAGPRQAAFRIGVGMVAAAQLDRVHAQSVGQLVEGGFQGEDAGGFAGVASTLISIFTSFATTRPPLSSARLNEM